MKDWTRPWLQLQLIISKLTAAGVWLMANMFQPKKKFFTTNRLEFDSIESFCSMIFLSKWIM